MIKLAYFVIFTILILSIFFWIPYKFKDCLKVGHSKLYCIVRIFE